MKQTYLDKARAGRTLTMQGKGPALPEKPPDPPEPRKPVEPDRTLENVRLAPDAAAAWGALGVTTEVPLSAARKMANDAAAGADRKIVKGWEAMAVWERSNPGEPPPASWVARLVELHAEQLDRFVDLDRVRVYEADALGLLSGDLLPGRAIAECLLDRALVAAEVYLRGAMPGDLGRKALAGLYRAKDDDDVNRTLAWGKKYVEEAIRVRYGE